MSVSDHVEKEDQKIREKTGLKTKAELEAYFFFYSNANFEYGAIMYGNVESEFYRQINEGLEKLFKTNNLYTKFGKEIDNQINEKISVAVKLKYNFWLNYFKKKGLISKRNRKFREDVHKYPKLLGYNPFNDPELYIIYKKPDVEGRIPINDEILALDKIQKLRQEGYMVEEPVFAIR